MYLFVWQHRWKYYGVLWYFTARESRPVPSGIVVCGRGGRVRRLRRRLFASSLSSLLCAASRRRSSCSASVSKSSWFRR